MLHAVLSGRPYSFVVAPVEGHASMVGFEVALDVLPEWLDRGLRRGLGFEQESVDGIRSKDETG